MNTSEAVLELIHSRLELNNPPATVDEIQTMSTQLHALFSSNEDDASQKIAEMLVQLVLPWSFPGLSSKKNFDAKRITPIQVFDWLVQTWLDSIFRDVSFKKSS